MRVMLVRPPYASAIFEPDGPRRLEVRAWQTHLRGPVAIVTTENRIIGVVELVDVHRTGGDACTDACKGLPGGSTGELVSATQTPLFHWIITNPRLLPDWVTFRYTAFMGITSLPAGYAAALEQALKDL